MISHGLSRLYSDAFKCWIVLGVVENASKTRWTKANVVLGFFLAAVIQNVLYYSTPHI